MSPYIQIRHLAAELEVGTNVSTICPFCSGGSSSEKSFSLTRADEATALYICHRASCSRSGKIACWGYRLSLSSPTIRSPRKPTRSVYFGNVCELGEGWKSELYTKYGLTLDDTNRFGWGEDLTTGRLVIPIRTRHGATCGTETRKQPPDFLRDAKHGNPNYDPSSPKTKNYFKDDSPRHNWFLRETGIRELVVVEDSISAIKTSRQIPCVSILGTHLNIDRVTDLLEFSKSLSVGGDRALADIVLALDKDATDKAVSYKKKFGIYGNFRVAVLSKDLKYESDERIKEIITGAK